MANVAWTELNVLVGHRNTRVYKWAAVNGGDECLPVACGGYNDKTVYGWRPTGSSFGGTVTVAGSPDPSKGAYTDTTDTYQTLSDPQGNAISKTGNFVEAVLEHAYWIKPVAGTGITLTDFYVVLASSK